MLALARNADDPQVVGLVPPAGSGLRHLPDGSGKAQHFIIAVHNILIGTAQWSDGRTRDFDTLAGQLSPLCVSVARNIPGWTDSAQSSGTA
ncbi:hypothetical protein [Kitasatospora phosalacinea]|uniref:Uncharacterized protein n=1 Tax=Kitasatospora phosalacinea TaxID=2065 RepID=A0A9W6PLG0_9ACTN|nr:hypothetical protein [Kitasatospora phosalacinea]GLW57001.1 hypothetical protein Kpho01_50120 [Kitasatospora phosalacinea]